MGVDAESVEVWSTIAKAEGILQASQVVDPDGRPSVGQPGVVGMCWWNKQEAQKVATP